MTYRTGQHGRMFIKNRDITSSTSNGGMIQIGSVRDWNINFQQETLDSTCLEDLDRTITNGLRAFSGGGTLLYYDQAVGNSSFANFLANFLSTSNGVQVGPDEEDWGSAAANAPGYVRLKLDLKQTATSTSTEEFEFYALITGFQVTCSVGEVVTGAFTFTGTGPLMSNTF